MKQIVIALILGLIIILSGCSSGNITGKSVDTKQEYIEIGSILLLTGTGTSEGQLTKRGMEMALEKINKEGVNGKKIRVHYEDEMGGNPKAGVTAVQKFISEDINIVVGPNWSPAAYAIAPIACDSNVLVISPNAGVAFNELCDYLFVLRPHDADINDDFGKYIYEKGFRRIAIMSSQQVWEKEQAEAVKKGFENAGGKVVDLQFPEFEENNYLSIATKVKDSNPDAIVFTNSVRQHIASQRLKELGVKVPFFSVLIYDDTINGAQGTMEGTIIVTSVTPTKDFSETYEAKYGEEPTSIGPSDGYDSIMLLVKAMKDTRSEDPTVLKNYLNSLKTYDGASGHLVFDGKGGVTKETKLLMVKGNRTVEIA